MASDNLAVQATQYACRCLNVRITTSTPTAPPPDYPREQDYTPVFVKDDGISVTHPQVTVRLTCKGVAIAGTSRCSRFTALTCLFCMLPIYRVHQVISLEVEGNEVTLLPTEEWVEHEIMKSPNGWIDIHKDSIVGDGIAKAEASSSYASSFDLLLPERSSPPSSPKMGDEESTPKRNTSPTPPPSYLSDLRPLFLPPPFTSSHPIFVRLAAIATEQSQDLRAAAEQRILDFINSETAGVEAKERIIKHQVEVLWKNFRQHLTTVQHERNQQSTARSPSRKEGERFPNGLVSPSATSSSVAIRSFVPVPVSLGVHPAPSSSLPRLSALSASLATSTFHHPKENQKGSSSGETSTGSYGSDSSQTTSTRSGSSTLVHPVLQTDGTNVLQFKRNINDTINTQASYRYFVNLDEDMARYKREQEKAIKKQREAEAAQQPGPSQTPIANGEKTPKKVQIADPQSSAAEPGTKPEDKATSSRGQDKGKRKVTFDVEPAVVTIQKDDKTEDDSENEDPREMIFEFEDLEPGVGGAERSTDARHTTLPLLDQPASRPIRVRKTRPQNNTALETFTSLRPSSLPNPSHIRPIRSQPGVDSSSQGMMVSLPKSPATITTREGPQRTASSKQQPPSRPLPSPLNEHDAELLKLVAADIPSHRGAWTPDSKAWQTFTRRQDSKDGVEHGKIPEEGEENTDSSSFIAPIAAAKPVRMSLDISEYDEDGDGHAESRIYGVAGSLPVHIKRIIPREPLTLASYRPQAALPEQEQASAPAPSTSHGNKPLSSAAIRKAVYAERDRVRSMDPGPLDFATEPSEVEDEEDEEENQPEDAGERARKQALRILQARSELPEEGMWRSLA